MKRIIQLLAFFCLLLFTYSCGDLLDIEVDSKDTPFSNNKAFITRSEAIVEYMGNKYSVFNEPLSIENARACFGDSTLVSTHQALCVFPENMEQLHRLERDKSLRILYHPFGYRLLPTSFEENYDDNTEEVPLETIEDCGLSNSRQSDTRDICPVYVLWPVSSPIPEDLKYDYLFDAYYMPDSNSNQGIKGPPSIPSITGYLKSYDNRLYRNTPINNVQLEYQNDLGVTQVSYTDNNGYFSLPCADSNYSIVINLTNDDFTIRNGETSNVKSFSFDLSDYSMSISNNEYDVSLPTNFFLDTYKAADYYFHGSNDLLDIVPIYDTLGVSMDIHAIDAPGPALGAFFYASPPYIYIWNAYKNNYSGASSKIFGTVLHELGHATNYAAFGSAYMIGTSSVIKESFASFFGWINVLYYYSSYIGTNQSLVNSICTQGRQDWPVYQYSNYTPINVDLYDDFNQHTLNSQFNDDPISDVPIPFIVSSALGPQTFQAVYTILLSGIGVYYTASEFYTFIAPYLQFLP